MTSTTVATSSFKDIPVLDALNYTEWSWRMSNYYFLFGYAGEEIENDKELLIELPDIDQIFESQGECYYCYDHTSDGTKATQNGVREHRAAVIAKEKINVQIKEDRVRLIAHFMAFMSEDSLTQMRSDEDYPSARKDKSSFRLSKCIMTSHCQQSSLPIICGRLVNFVTMKQTSFPSLSPFIVAHGQAVIQFTQDFESPDPAHKGYVAITTLSSALMVTACGPQFDNLKDTNIYERKLHSLKYEAVTRQLTLHASAREQLPTTTANSLVQKVLHLQQAGQGNLAMTVQSDVLAKTPPAIKETLTCKGCKKQFKKQLKTGSTDEYFDRCRDCNMSNLKARKNQLADSDAKALSNAHATIARLGKTVNSTTTSDLKEATVPIAPANSIVNYNTKELSYRDMLAYAMMKDQVNVTQSEDVCCLSSQNNIPVFYKWDNCASLSVCGNQAASELHSYVLTPNAGAIKGLTGASVTPIGYGYLTNFPIENFKIHHIPESQVNVISLDQVCLHGGSYGRDRNKNELIVRDCNNRILSDTPRLPNGTHLVPPEYISPTSPNEILASIATHSSSLNVSNFHFTKEQFLRMKLVFDLHVFLSHLGFNVIKNGIHYHAFGRDCILVPSDVDRLLSFIGRCAICDIGKMQQLSMTELSTTPPAEKPGWKWTMDTQSLPKKHHGGFTDCASFRDDHSGVPRVFGIIGKSTEESLMPAVIQLTSFCLSHGRHIREIVPDSEANLVALKVPCGLIGILVHPVPPKEHGHAMERCIQTIDNLVTCSIASMPHKFKPEYTLYLKQAAAAALALVPTLGKDQTTCGYTIFTERCYEYHAKYPFLPVGGTVLAEVGVAHRSNESFKTGLAYNNSPKSELGINLGPDLYGTQMGCYLILPASGHIMPRRNFEPINAIMTGWEPNNVVRQSQKQFEIVEDIADDISQLQISPEEPEQSTKISIHSNDFQTILKPTAIEVPSDFYSIDPSTVSSIPSSLTLHSNNDKIDSTLSNDESLDLITTDTVKVVPIPSPLTTIGQTPWTRVTSKRTDKLTASNIVPFSMRTRQSSSKANVATPSQQTCLIIQNSIIKLKKDIQTEFSLNQAMKRPNIAPKIPAAINKEIGKIDKFSAGHKINKEDIPKTASILYFLARIKEKMLLDGETDPQINARIVVDGLRQKRDYPNQIRETFAGTPNMGYLVILIAVIQAAAILSKRLKEFSLTSLDIEAAFLQTDQPLNTPMEVAQLPTNIPHHRAGEWIVIDCGWYGKDNGNRLFWIDFANTVLTIPGVDRCPLDSSKYIWINKKDVFQKVLLSAHVDDGAIITTWQSKALDVEHILVERYGPLKLYKPMKNYLGLQFDYHPSGAITIHMKTHITNLISDFEIPLADPQACKQPEPLNILKRDSNSPPFDVKTMQRANGKILFPAVQIRSDILLSAQHSCSNNINPTVQDANNLLHIVEYLASTTDLGPTFWTSGGPRLLAKCDTAFAVDPITGQSRTALSFHIGDYENAACWSKTWLLTIISNAATLSEFIGMSDVARINNEVRNLLEWAGFPQLDPTPVAFFVDGSPQYMPEPTPLQNDCKSAIRMVTAEDMTKQGKHFRARENYIRQEYQLGSIAPTHVSTKDFSIDFMTKPCVGSDFKSKRNQHFNVKANPNFTKYL